MHWTLKRARMPAATNQFRFDVSTAFHTHPSVATINAIPMPYGRIESVVRIIQGLSPTRVIEINGTRQPKSRHVSHNALRTRTPTRNPKALRPGSVPKPMAIQPRRTSVDRRGNESYWRAAQGLDTAGMLANSTLLMSPRDSAPACGEKGN